VGRHLGTSADVVIAGAGIAGIAAAWGLTRRRDNWTVLLVDPRQPLSLTSNRPEANYRNWWPQPAMVELANRSIDLMADLRSSGATFAMNQRGYLYVTADAATAERLPARIADYRGAGLGPEAADLLEPGEIRARFPHLSPGIRGAIHALRAGSVDTVGLGVAMLEQERGGGIELAEGRVIGVDFGSGGVRSVTVSTPNGLEQVETSRFVDAAGPWAGDVAHFLGVRLPIDTVLRQKVLMHDPLGLVPRSAPFTIGLDDLGGRPPGVHIKPDESIADDAIKLGWAVDQNPQPPNEDPACPRDFPNDVLARAATIIPGLAAYLDRDPGIIDHDGGFYARTPDGMPLIGPLGVEGAYVLAGLAGFGAMMAPAAGELIAGWILGDEPAGWATDFKPARFSGEFDRLRTIPGSATSGEL
jgi:glycine/D-amino acid oxidase-like deaminating enzyme